MEGVRPMETILAALITGAVTLIGVLIANGKSQAVTDTKLEEQMKVANHRIADLEANEHTRERN